MAMRSPAAAAARGSALPCAAPPPAAITRVLKPSFLGTRRTATVTRTNVTTSAERWRSTTHSRLEVKRRLQPTVKTRVVAGSLLTLHELTEPAFAEEGTLTGLDGSFSRLPLTESVLPFDSSMAWLSTSVAEADLSAVEDSSVSAPLEVEPVTLLNVAVTGTLQAGEESGPPEVFESVTKGALSDAEAAQESIRDASGSVGDPTSALLDATTSPGLDAPSSFLSETPTDAAEQTVSELKSAADRYRELLGGGSSEPAKEAPLPDVNPIVAAQEALSNAVTSVNEAVTGAVNTGKESLSSIVNSVVDSVNGVLQTSEQALSRSVESSKAAVGGVAEQLGLPPLPPLPSPPPIPRIDLPPEVVNAAEAVLSTTSQAAATTFSQVGTATGQVAGKLYLTIKEQLPPEALSVLEVVEEKVQEASGPTTIFIKKALLQLGAAANTAFRSAEVLVGLDPDDPLIAPVAASIVVAGGTAVFIFFYQRAQAAGYSGDLSPEDSLQLLKEEFDALLLDIRPQSLRDEDGIPDLRRGARFKDASVEFERVSGPVRGLLTNPDEVDAKVMAAKVRGLKGVGAGAKVLVMDDAGSDEAREVARALRKYGGFGRSYRVGGGFQAWARSLRTKPDAPESIAVLLKQEAEAFVEEVRPTPLGVASVAVGIGLAAYAVTEWEKSLQLLGIVAIARVLYSRFQSYDSVEDVKADLLFLLSPLSFAAAAAMWVGGLIDGAGKEGPRLAAAAEGAGGALSDEGQGSTGEEGGGGAVLEASSEEVEAPPPPEATLPQLELSAAQPDEASTPALPAPESEKSSA